MHCSNCGVELTGERNFCPQCGASLTHTAYRPRSTSVNFSRRPYITFIFVTAIIFMILACLNTIGAAGDVISLSDFSIHEIYIESFDAKMNIVLTTRIFALLVVSSVSILLILVLVFASKARSRLSDNRTKLIYNNRIKKLSIALVVLTGVWFLIDLVSWGTLISAASEVGDETLMATVGSGMFGAIIRGSAFLIFMILNLVKTKSYAAYLNEQPLDQEVDFN